MSYNIEKNETLLVLLNVTKLAQVFEVTELTITIWRDRKQLPYIRIKGDRRDAVRYDARAVYDWIDAQEERYTKRQVNEIAVRLELAVAALGATITLPRRATLASRVD